MSWLCDELLDSNNLPNKAGEAYIRLFHEEWMTKMTIQAYRNEDGYFFKGFMGDYNLKILQGSTIIGEIEFKLDHDLEIFCIGDGFSSIICNQN